MIDFEQEPARHAIEREVIRSADNPGKRESKEAWQMYFKTIQ